MKYFTREQHDDLNSGDARKVAASHEEFRHSCDQYRLQLVGLKTRLAGAWTFFDSVSLHDGTLLSLRIGDDIDKNFPASAFRIVNDRKPVVEIEALHCTETQLYTLRYERLHRALFDFPGTNPWYMRFADRASNPIDDWMADELTEVDDRVLRHEVLFSSGSTLLLEFETIEVRTANIKGRDELPYVPSET